MVSLQAVTQAEFAADVGISQQAVSDLVSKGVLENGAPEADWLLAYCHRLREQAAGRMGSEVGGLDLAQERAALAREQRIGIEIKNQVLRGKYAPIALLAEVLASASQAVTERFEHLPGVLKKAVPDLPSAASGQRPGDDRDRRRAQCLGDRDGRAGVGQGADGRRPGRAGRGDR